MRKYKLAVFIGRFQPYHLGHHSVITNALNIADNVLVLLGSAGEPRSCRNPFTATERMSMILRSFDVKDRQRIFFRELEDYPYNDEKWIEQVQEKVTHAADWAANPDPFAERVIIQPDQITLVGHSKDHTSYYLKLFPQWHSEDCGNVNNLSSTDIREVYFLQEEKYRFTFGGDMPSQALDFLREFAKTEDFKTLQKEFNFVEDYKNQWTSAPFPPTFVTVDSVVVQSGHVLLVKRKGFPGVGQWALPGGFLNQTETLEEACLRELKEETRIKVPVPVLKGNITATRVFDSPHRSSRGRTITHAFLIHLPAEESLPKVRGSDDAEKAKWVPLSSINREMMFEDHFSILETMLGMI